jgi:hypothetical protein
VPAAGHARSAARGDGALARTHLGAATDTTRWGVSVAGGEREASTTTPEEEPELIAEGYEFSVAMEAATQEEKEEGVFLCSGKSDGW